MTPLGIDGAWRVDPRQHADDRGTFLEWFRLDRLAEAIGHPLHLSQANCSVSRRGVLRGIHYADVPPSQAKYVTCTRGAALDVVVDIRVGSPTFGGWEAVRLDDVDRSAVYLSEGLGHAFMALTDDATVVYLCSTEYAPQREHGIHPLDKDVAIDWPDDVEPVLSGKDVEAPGLLTAQESGALPTYEECVAYTASLAR
ncbi:MAG: dTDP-4-dehydrorhamnose 3,5-epimerase family protein [Actinomycetes bacterium]